MTTTTSAVVTAVASGMEPEIWHTFFSLTGTAGAALTGLFFIAFSLRVRDLQGSLVLRTRARYLLIGLVVITVGSGFVVIPRQALWALGAEVLTISVIYGAYSAWSLVRAARREPIALTADLVGRWVGMAITLGLSSASGVSLMSQAGAGLYLLAFSMLLGLALEMASAWSLIVGIGKDTRTTVNDSRPPERVDGT